MIDISEVGIEKEIVVKLCEEQRQFASLSAFIESYLDE